MDWSPASKAAMWCVRFVAFIVNGAKTLQTCPVSPPGFSFLSLLHSTSGQCSGGLRVYDVDASWCCYLFIWEAHQTNDLYDANVILSQLHHNHRPTCCTLSTLSLMAGGNMCKVYIDGSGQLLPSPVKSRQTGCSRRGRHLNLVSVYVFL